MAWRYHKFLLVCPAPAPRTGLEEVEQAILPGVIILLARRGTMQSVFLKARTRGTWWETAAHKVEAGGTWTETVESGEPDLPGSWAAFERAPEREKSRGSWPTRNRATAVPRMKPAITSEQWFRYSETRLRPVRKAVQRVPRHSTGLASRLLFVLIVLVMYI